MSTPMYGNGGFTVEDDSSVPGDTTFLLERNVSVSDFTSADLLLLLVRVGRFDFNVEELYDFSFSDDCKFNDRCKECF